MNYKKIIFLILFCCIFFTGCGGQYDDFKHYDLKSKDITTYTVHYDDGDAIYAIADISDIAQSAEMQVHGLFYQVSENDYILIEQFSLRNSPEDSVKLYNDELYVLTKGEDGGSYVYKLNKEKFSKKSIQFKATDIVAPTMIKDIKDGEIYLFGNTFDGKSNISSNFKCSLDTYNCEQIDS